MPSSGGKRGAAQRARLLELGRKHYADHAWDEAYAALAEADQLEPLAVDDLELLAWAAGLTDRDHELLGLLERLHQTHVEAGNCEAAARAAFWIGFRLFALAEPGRATGWIGRAQRLIEQLDEESVVQGYLMLPVAHRELAIGDNVAAEATAAAAASLGERYGEADLTAFARHMQGRAQLRQGRVEEGLALIDEAMVATTTGELSPLITGLLYCSVIASCQQVYALDRAREWTAALSDWCAAQPQLVTFTGACLVHRAEILQLGGEWPQAIEEARRASERLNEDTDPEATADAFYQQGEIFRLQGKLNEAEAAYRSASEHGREPQPGLSLLRLAEGRADAAAAAMRRVVGATSNPLRRARLLPAHVEILVAAGDLEAAREACTELEDIASTFDTPVLGAMAAHARGVLLLAEGDAQGAVEPLRRAFQIWRDVGAPYLAAKIRVSLGLACRALGDDDGAGLELGAARRVFENLGASPDIAELDSLTNQAPAAPGGLSPRELEVLRLVASGMTNKRIARQLCLSEKTIDRHVSNIFHKIHVSSRSAATAYAYQHDLV